MRRALDGLYTGAAYLAAACMVLLGCMVLAGIISRLAGFNLPGIDAYAGYLMAGAGFLALAQTFNKGEHIRVTLLVQKAKPSISRGLELWSLFAASVLAGLFAAYSARLAWQSHSFNDISTGNDATPLWIPQILMAVGAAVFFIAVLDAFVAALQGKANVASSTDLLKSE
jgi:TRAP-type C4-dicarboxylate transport system permease small subunit